MNISSADATYYRNLADREELTVAALHGDPPLDDDAFSVLYKAVNDIRAERQALVKRLREEAQAEALKRRNPQSR